MNDDANVPLVLGGHSFIEQLGSDPIADAATQIEIVRACLDAGITWFDTTYLPERIALGKALSALGRRDEATIIAWNFFVDFSPGDELGGPRAYVEGDLDVMCEQLATNRIDCLVVHGVADTDESARQTDLAACWRRNERIDRLGVWAPGADAESVFGPDNPFDFMVRPYNVAQCDAEPFAACKRLEWTNLACTPFVRGWELDKLVAWAGEGERSRIADAMLRFSLFAENVDRLIVAIRKVEWVAANIESVRRGPLTADEREWLMSLIEDKSA